MFPFSRLAHRIPAMRSSIFLRHRGTLPVHSIYRNFTSRNLYPRNGLTLLPKSHTRHLLKRRPSPLQFQAAHRYHQDQYHSHRPQDEDDELRNKCSGYVLCFLMITISVPIAHENYIQLLEYWDGELENPDVEARAEKQCTSGYGLITLYLGARCRHNRQLDYVYYWQLFLGLAMYGLPRSPYSVYSKRVLFSRILWANYYGWAILWICKQSGFMNSLKTRNMKATEKREMVM